jgi:hypothetical protein
MLKNHQTHPMPKRPVLLLVQDNCYHFFLNLEKLQSTGDYDVSWADSHQLAMTLFKQHRGKIDAVLLDANFPKSQSNDDFLPQMENDYAVYRRSVREELADKRPRVSQAQFNAMHETMQQAKKREITATPELESSRPHPVIATGRMLAEDIRREELRHPQLRPVLMITGDALASGNPCHAPFDQWTMNNDVALGFSPKIFQDNWNSCGGDLRRLDDRQSAYRGNAWLKQMKDAMKEKRGQADARTP